MTTFQPLDCSIILYRAVTKPSGINKQTGKLRVGTFQRRGPDAQGRPRDTSGLSVNFTEAQAVKYCPGRLAVCTIHTGRVRDIDLGVVLDVIQNKPDHANITGLPAYGADPKLAEDLATELAEMARLIPGSETY